MTNTDSEIYTGRHVVVFAPAKARGNHANTLASVAGLSNIVHSRDFENQAMDISAIAGADATVFDELGLAVVDSDAEQTVALQAAAEAGDMVLSVEPELIHHALTVTSPEYLSGYQHGVSDFFARLQADTTVPTVDELAAAYADSDKSTWGLQATKANTSSKTGRGVRVAVLDTGFDASHPDFKKRHVTMQSFVDGETSEDAHGHGTHCVGTSCGPRSPRGSRRYGAATEAEIFVGKVLGNSGSGSDGGILAGINWAVANNCAIISMSLGANVDKISLAYETVGQRALDRGSLIIAAAGNNANRRAGEYGFVGVPANSRSIMAIAAVDSSLNPGWFSARSSTKTKAAGHIDLAGPGVDVYSSWLMPKRYNSISGTSMATPHVSGIAALWCEATGLTGRQLWTVLLQQAVPLNVPAVDVGAGLVQAPQ
ncbi:S8 family serine peptidase [Mycobacteroides sp. LB1]|uniref:S8 family serine peptidase n=1 Tax=Mycobacteroides sp. LB1 TaxID=2750814 RepID=UPI0015DFBE04|nr:S8 family serine peptidase [Mycobacteroides sp. LB1]